MIIISANNQVPQRKYDTYVEEIKIRSVIKNPIEEKINRSKREAKLKLNRVKIQDNHRKRSFKDENIHLDKAYKDIGDM